MRWLNDSSIRKKLNFYISKLGYASENHAADKAFGDWMEWSKQELQY